MLSSLGNYPDPSNDQVFKFDVSNVKPCLPYHVEFQINVVHSINTIRRTVVNECVLTCVMALYCWKDLGPMKITPSPTLILLMGDIFDHMGLFLHFLSN